MNFIGFNFLVSCKISLVLCLKLTVFFVSFVEIFLFWVIISNLLLIKDLEVNAYVVWWWFYWVHIQLVLDSSTSVINFEHKKYNHFFFLKASNVSSSGLNFCRSLYVNCGVFLGKIFFSWQLENKNLISM